MRFTRLILALTSFLILITQTDLFASTVLHKTSMVDLSNNAIMAHPINQGENSLIL